MPNDKTLEQFLARGRAAQQAVDAAVETARAFATRDKSPVPVPASQAELDLYTGHWREHPSFRYDRVTELMQLCLLRRPSDYPGLYVVRAWFVSVAGARPGPMLGFGVEQMAVNWIEQEFPELVRVARADADDPNIVAVWT